MPSRDNRASDPTERSDVDLRRMIVLFIALACWVGYGLAWAYGEQGSGDFAAAAMGRIGLVLSALWLAWPSLRRPARWLPPGMAVAGVVMLAFLAAQPRLVVPAVGAFAALLAVGALIRAAKGKHRH